MANFLGVLFMLAVIGGAIYLIYRTKKGGPAEKLKDTIDKMKD